mmetsp:Transcript_1096/g.1677  ORF Transcript_1096/g.1677 Transcript_1096/m.1677 type:complete len:115 (+) Transcript_1096:1338-1682(+)
MDESGDRPSASGTHVEPFPSLSQHVCSHPLPSPPLRHPFPPVVHLSTLAEPCPSALTRQSRPIFIYMPLIILPRFSVNDDFSYHTNQQTLHGAYTISGLGHVDRMYIHTHIHKQ